MTAETRSFGALSLTLTGVGTVIGAGIFVITGQAAAALAGPAIALSFVIACIVCIFSALCYAEMAAMIPDKGSAYSYTKAAFGPRIGCETSPGFMAEIMAVYWGGMASKPRQPISPPSSAFCASE